MEISTHQNSLIPSFQRYSQCEGGSGASFDVCMDDYTFHADFTNCDDECSSMGSSVPSFGSDSEGGSDNSDMIDDGSSGIRLRERTRSGCVELTASSEMLRIRFPFQSISVRLADFLCLQENDLLNDTIVDFYLNHVVEHILPDEPSQRVTVLPSVFWHNLSILHSAAQVDDADVTLTDDQKLDARFGDVLDFVEDFDFIDVDYIIVPVNEWEHWSLVIVCHPFTARARMLCFDSQLSEDPNNMQNIAVLCDDFLKYVWMRRNQQTLCSMERMRCIFPNRLPQQSNNYDCGLYIVEFARRFLLAPPSNLDAFDFTAEYPDFSVKNKRRDIQRAILSLCSNRELWTPILDILNKKM